jgi:hypothetical protein
MSLQNLLCGLLLAAVSASAIATASAGAKHAPQADLPPQTAFSLYYECTGDLCTTTNALPPGSRFVITHIDGLASFTAEPVFEVLTYDGAAPQSQQWLSPTRSADSTAYFASKVELSTSQLPAVNKIAGSLSTSTISHFYLSGYLLKQ